MEKAFVAAIALLFALEVLLGGGLSADVLAMAFGKIVIPAAIGLGLVAFARKRGKRTTWFAAASIAIVFVFAGSTIAASVRDTRRTMAFQCTKEIQTQEISKARGDAYCGCIVGRINAGTLAGHLLDKFAGGTRVRDGMQNAVGICQAEAIKIPEE